MGLEILGEALPAFCNSAITDTLKHLTFAEGSQYIATVIPNV